MKTTSKLVIALATLGLGLSVSETAQAAAPVITYVQGWGNSEIKIQGDYFGTTAGSVSVNGAPATVSSWSSTTILASNPLNWPASTLVVVTTSAGATATFSFFRSVTVLGTAAHDHDVTETVTNVSLNGGGNQLHVSPGATVTLDLDYSACSDCALQFGFNTGEPQACFFAPVTPGTAVGHSTQTLTAPTTPGIYYVLFDRNQNLCAPAWDWGTPPATQALGAISVY
jgi:IPT/TIG domain